MYGSELVSGVRCWALRHPALTLFILSTEDHREYFLLSFKDPTGQFTYFAPKFQDIIRTVLLAILLPSATHCDTA